MRRFLHFHYWLGSLAGLLAVTLSLDAAAARDFTIASWGGATQDGKRIVYFAPFAEEHGIAVQEGVYQGGWGQFRAIQETGERPWDVVSVEPAEMVRGCEEGLFKRLDWSQIGPADRYLPGVVHECGLGAFVSAQTVGYNAELIGDTRPTRIEDFFDLDTWPGKRGILDRPKPTLEWVLLADGVATKDVFSVLRTPEGVDRAFAKLETIKPELRFWTAGAQPPEWLINGEVVMSQIFSGRVANAKKEGRPLEQIWDRAIVYLDYWVVFEEIKHLDDAYAFLRFFSDPRRQVEYAITQLPYGPISQGAMELIPAEVAAVMPAGDNLATAHWTGSQEDIDFWIDHNDELTERWNRWKAQ
jgi:putative spermidine/putrescine transport system substrate-binding protein